jgi:hypothetical protein
MLLSAIQDMPSWSTFHAVQTVSKAVAPNVYIFAVPAISFNGYLVWFDFPRRGTTRGLSINYQTRALSPLQADHLTAHLETVPKP